MSLLRDLFRCLVFSFFFLFFFFLFTISDDVQMDGRRKALYIIHRHDHDPPKIWNCKGDVIYAHVLVLGRRSDSAVSFGVTGGRARE